MRALTAIVATATIGTSIAALAGLGATGAVAAPDPSPTTIHTYRVTGAVTAQRNAISATGVDILHRDGSSALVSGLPSEIDALRTLGLTLTEAQSPADVANLRAATVAAQRKAKGERTLTAGDFPSGDEAYHTYPETVAALDAAVKNYPALASKVSAGKSVENRDLWFLKLGKAPAGSPEVVITCNQHAREHLTTEQCLYLVDELTTKYATDTRIKTIMDTRTVWVMPIMNPDGSTYDIAGGTYQNWRKNRQKNSDGSIGIDPNRNWGYKWACCQGSSSTPSSMTYHGPSAFAAPEPKAIADFVKSRKVNGVQQIKAFMDIHTYSELVMWPFGYTQDKIVPGMTQDQYDMHEALGKKLASSDNYTPEQSSSLYVTDGDSMDWTWGDQQIPTIGVEMYPSDSFGTAGFYPPASVIPRETQRNREMLLTFIELADCQYKLTGKQNTYCKTTPTPTPTSTPTPTGTPTSTPTPTPTPTSTPTGTPTSTPTNNPTTPAPAPGGNAVVNGDFEQGDTAWTGTSGVINDIVRNGNYPSHSGTFKLWLGGNGRTSTEYKQQTITVPAGSPKLTFWYGIDSAETTRTSKYDTATVSVNGKTLASFSNLDETDDYVQKTIDLSAYAGQSVTLKLSATEDSVNQTSFVFDDVAVQ